MKARQYDYKWSERTLIIVFHVFKFSKFLGNPSIKILVEREFFIASAIRLTVIDDGTILPFFKRSSIMAP